jgi:hypothetical protein
MVRDENGTVKKRDWLAELPSKKLLLSKRKLKRRNSPIGSVKNVAAC